MEWSIKTVLIFIVIFVMIGILVDGFRRMRRNQAAALKLNIEDIPHITESDYNSELPSGGARVVKDQTTVNTAAEQASDDKALDALTRSLNITDEQDVPLSPEPMLSTAAERAPDTGGEHDVTHTAAHTDAQDSAHNNQVPAFESPTLDLSQDAPVLMAVDEMGDLPLQHGVQAPSASHQTVPVAPDQTEQAEEHPATDSTADGGQEHSVENYSEEPLVASGDSEPCDVDSFDEGDTPASETVIEQEEAQADSESVDEPDMPEVLLPGEHAECLANRSQPEKVLVVHVIAEDGAKFDGNKVLYLFNQCDLRLGERDLFHRFEEAGGNGRVQFSVSQSFEPGSFDLNTLNKQQFSGLSFFMSLPGPEKMKDAYEAMSQMAKLVAKQLGGDVLDESHSALTSQTISHHREQIADFERKQRLRRMKSV